LGRFSGEVFFITGLSGAGKSQTLNFLEDAGFYCVDNLPPALIDKFIHLISHSGIENRKIALGVDTRSKEFFSDFLNALSQLKVENIAFNILFLDAKDEILIKRFGETRREHPLEGPGTLEEKISRERVLLSRFKEMADDVIDTSSTSAKELWKKLSIIFKEEAENSFYINVVSFGFKYGIPLSSDMVFDVRFIPNPFYIPELSELTGNDKKVFDYVYSYKITKKFSKQVYNLVNLLVPEYKKEGKNSLEIAFGCTGGQHRSVSVANYIKKCLESRFPVRIFHRQLDGG